MTLLSFIRILYRNFLMLAGAGIITGLGIFYSTKDQNRFYTSHMVINTGLVSGYNIESQGGGKIDFAYTNTEISNLINLAQSRHTTEELALRLLGYLIWMGDTIINSTYYHETMDMVPKATIDDIRGLPHPDSSYSYLAKQYQNNIGSPVFDLLNSKNQIVGINHLSTINVEREGGSDMIRFTFRTIDPRVCLITLDHLTHIFVDKHKQVKSTQTTDVLDFFKESTDKSHEKLLAAEAEMLNFQTSNKIINYYEQTRFISGNKEDLEDQFLKERMAWAAADSARKQIEEQLASQIKLPELNIKIDSIRQQLAAVNKELVKQSLARNVVDEAETDFLTSKSNNLKSSLRDMANDNMRLTVSKDGLETKTLLEAWLDQIIDLERSNARMEIMEERREEFSKIYGIYAPLGSMLKQLERKIDVAERAYMENLHSYNLARLHQHNMMMTTNLKVVDPPYLPTEPEKSKRLMSVILGTLTTPLILLALIIGREFVDVSMKDPDHAELQTEYPVTGALPKVNRKNKKILWDDVLSRTTGLIVQHLKNENKGSNMAITSFYKTEGKTQVAQWLTEFGKQKTIDELPALFANPASITEMKKFDTILLVMRANRSWTPADKRMLDHIKKEYKGTLHVLLNAVQTDKLENYIGEVPKKRSKLRVITKRIFSGEFH